MRHSYQATLGACFAGYIVQSVINLFAPLLFLTFQREFSLSLDQIALLITVNFLGAAVRRRPVRPVCG